MIIKNILIKIKIFKYIDSYRFYSLFIYISDLLVKKKNKFHYTNCVSST